MNVGDAVLNLTGRFRKAGIDTARLDARVLTAHVLGVEPERVFGYPETVLSDAEQQRLTELSRRREGREPLARIIGEKEFWSLTFQVSEDTLIPRPETETVIEAVLDRIDARSGSLKVLDLGTGSGCLLISLLSELPRAEGVGIDISQGALQTATENARQNGVAERAQFIQNDWCSGLAEPYAGVFDIIVSNPPYIANGEIGTLEPEVSVHEPERALAGGPDGLDSYRMLVRDAGALLAPAGILAFEVGWTQAEQVERMARDQGFDIIGQYPDLVGVARCVVLGNR